MNNIRGSPVLYSSMVSYQSKDLSYFLDLIGRLEGDPSDFLDDSELLKEISTVHDKLLMKHARSASVLRLSAEHFLLYYKLQERARPFFYPINSSDILHTAEEKAAKCEKLVRQLGVGSFYVSI